MSDVEDLINFYNYLPEDLMPHKVKNKGYNEHHVNFPCRIIVSGRSNSGKSLAIINFLKKCKDQFNKLTIITKKAEPLYLYLKKKNPQACEIIELSEGHNFPKISDFDGSIQNFVIFDDIVNSKEHMNLCKEFFIRGRKLSPYALNQCFITQDYFKTDSMLRKNMTNVWIFKPSSSNEMKSIERDHPVLKDIPHIWSYLNKKNKDDVNKFINIDCDTGQVRINFTKKVLNLM